MLCSREIPELALKELFPETEAAWGLISAAEGKSRSACMESGSSRAALAAGPAWICAVWAHRLFLQQGPHLLGRCTQSYLGGSSLDVVS